MATIHSLLKSKTVWIKDSVPVLFNIFFTYILSHATRGRNLCLISSDWLTFLISSSRCQNKNCSASSSGGSLRWWWRPQGSWGNLICSWCLINSLWFQNCLAWKSVLARQKYRPEPNIPLAPAVTIDVTHLPNVDTFKYLGNAIPRYGWLNKEINARISKASHVLGRFSNSDRPGQQKLNFTGQLSSIFFPLRGNVNLCNEGTSRNWKRLP